MLTIKQEKFVNKYLECGNASESYRYAYDTRRMKDSTVNRSAFQLLQDPKIAARLNFLKSHLAEAAGISALKIIREHQKIAFADATKIRKGWMDLKEFEDLTESEKACIKSIETRKVTKAAPDGAIITDILVKVQMYDKQKALDSITDMLGYNAPKEIDAKISGERPIITFSNEEEDA